MNENVDIIHPAPQIELGIRVAEALKNASPGGSRWMDQKVTFDNIFTVANAVTLSTSPGVEFTWSDLANSHYLQKTVSREYGKPELDNENARNEYNKFLMQPLTTLAFAGVLDSEKSRVRFFSVKDRALLEEIASSEDKARSFLISYLEQVIRNWGWWGRFETYFGSAQEQDDFLLLKNQFRALMLEKTEIGSRGSKSPETEINRIFPKVLNPLAFAYGAKGTEKGRVMKTIPSRFDLVYNRPNFRDTSNQKPKNLTRQQFELLMAQESRKLPNQTQLSAVMRAVRNYHGDISEVPDISGGKARHVHHIFPKSAFPKLAEVKENLIALTSAQHLFEAHPNGDTSKVDKIFQRNALLYKLESIKKSTDSGDGMYSFDGLAEVLSIGYLIPKPTPDYRSCKESIISHLV